MAHITEDRILETTTTTGTGVLSLAGAVTGFRAFSAKMAIGDTCHYLVQAVDGAGRPTGAYEFGKGTYSAANQLTRTTVIGSSNADAAVAFAAGSKQIMLTILAPKTTNTAADWRVALGLDAVNNTADSAKPISTAQQAAITAAAPPGLMSSFAQTSVPTGWLKCNGALVSRTTYAALFAIIGTTYGVGDGSTTFGLPEVRGEFIRVLDDGRGIDTSRVLGTAQGDAIRNMTGSAGIVYRAAANGSTGVMSLTAFGSTPARGGTIGTDAGDNVNVAFNASSQVPTAAENRPRNVAFPVYIKF